MNRTCSIAVATAMSVLLPQFANAQAGTGAVRGQVVDSQSRAIVGGRGALTDENNRLVRTQLTGGLGEFTFVGLPPATYRIDCEAVGFKKMTIGNFDCRINRGGDVPVFEHSLWTINRWRDRSSRMDPIRRSGNQHCWSS